MKISIIIFLLILFSAKTDGQTLEEWIQQKKTQKKYLLQQISGLQLYIGYLQKGYSIAGKGLSFIGELKKGEYDLHQDYFANLKSVNPTIKNYVRIADILSIAFQTLHSSKSAFKGIKRSKVLTQKELNHIQAVYGRLLNASSNTISELMDVITSGKLQMTDDERISRIELLYDDVQDQYKFSQRFNSENKLMIVARLGEKKEVEFGRNIYGIK